jgi:hypothetical protein
MQFLLEIVLSRSWGNLNYMKMEAHLSWRWKMKQVKAKGVSQGHTKLATNIMNIYFVILICDD